MPELKADTEKNQAPTATPDGKPPEDRERPLEELFDDLDGILSAMGDREVTLEDAFSLYEKGMKKIRQCNEKLDLVEKKMLVIAQDGTEEIFS
ncbi:MAG: exodeoxyribonuclease VII small subunit [Clostridiales bacterium]|nr:exodeoxyribonuclease VII small subunit [Clostridiales bacterium]